MLHYSKSLKAIRVRTESLYEGAKRRLTKSVRSGRRRAGDTGHNEGGCVAVDDFKATEKGQLSVTKGQRLEVVEYYTEAPEWVLVSITWENGEQQQGLVPCSVISSVEPAAGRFSGLRRSKQTVIAVYSAVMHVLSEE